MSKIFPFVKLSKEMQIEKCSIPQAAPVTIDPDNETTEHLIERQEKFLNLPEEIQAKLASQETSKEILKIGKNFHLELLEVASIARAVRNYYFREISLEDFPKIFFEEIRIDKIRALEISKTVISKIINNSSQEEKYNQRIEKLSILEAIKKYPAINEQQVTSSLIKTKNVLSPIKPSVKNWIYDYTMKLGREFHSAMERGAYLFQDENTRGLNLQDRQRLSLILKSFDEDISLEIDTNKKQIIFTQILSTPVQAPPKPPTLSKPQTQTTSQILDYNQAAEIPQKIRKEIPQNPSEEKEVSYVNYKKPDISKKAFQNKKIDWHKIREEEEKQAGLRIAGDIAPNIMENKEKESEIYSRMKISNHQVMPFEKRQSDLNHSPTLPSAKNFPSQSHNLSQKPEPTPNPIPPKLQPQPYRITPRSLSLKKEDFKAEAKSLMKNVVDLKN